MTDKIRTELLNNACDGVWQLIEAHSRFMNMAELDEFMERMHTLLYGMAKELGPKPRHPKPRHEDDCTDCPRCKHPDCRHVNGLCNYARDCGCDYYVRCTCGHTVGAHFDGMMDYRACLNESCECLKFDMGVKR